MLIAGSLPPFFSIKHLTRRKMASPPADPCYITRLNEDVLLKIFNIAIEHRDGVYDSWRAFPSPDWIALTCKSWRTIMLSYGTPWSVLNLDNEVLTKHRYERSGGSLLKVYWRDHTPRIDAFISQNLHRICLLDGYVEPDVEHCTPNWLFHGDGRSLRHIRLWASRDAPRITDLRLFAEGVPQRMHTLSLWNLCPKLTGSGFGSLTSLDLNSLHLGDSADEFKALLAILEASPSLETLLLSTERDWIPPRSLDSPLPSGERMPLLHLKSVSLDGPLPFPSMLLRLLQVPDTAECHVLVFLQESNSMDPLDLLGPDYFPATCFAPLDELSIRSTFALRPPNHDEILISNSQFSYTRRPIMPSSKRSLNITHPTEATAQDLLAILKKYPTSGVTYLRVGWEAGSGSDIKNTDVMPILPRLPALTSLEYTVRYSEHIQRHVPCAFKSVPTNDILPSDSSTPNSHRDPALPVIRDIVFRVLQMPLWGGSFAALDETVWCAEVLESLAAFAHQFPGLERLTLVSYNPDDSPSAQVWAKSALTRFGVDVRVSVRVEHLADPYYARRVKAV